MGVKTAGVGHFTIPTAPAAGTSVTSGAANTFTTTPVQLIASTAAALFITGVHLEAAAAKAATYIIVQLMIGAGGSETIIGQYLVPLSTGSTVALGYRQIYPFIPVANGIRISAKTADSVGTAATLVTLECIAQSNVVDDAIPVSRVTLVDTLTTYTGNTPQTGDSFLVVKSGGTGDNAAIKAKTDNLPAAPASTTNITAGTITTVTNLTNLPAIPANWVTAAGITAAALNGKGDWNIGKTGYSLVAGYDPAKTAAQAGDAMALTSGERTTLAAAIWNALTSGMATVASIGKKLADWTIGTAQTGDAFARLGAPAGASMAADVAAVKTDTAAVKAQTDQVAFTVAGQVDVNLKSVKGAAILGSGTAIDPWTP